VDRQVPRRCGRRRQLRLERDLGAEYSFVKPIGFALATAVFIDAFVVRMTIVPAVMSLLGRAAWWLPRPLDRVLPNVDNTYTGETIIAGGILNVASVSNYGIVSTIGAALPMPSPSRAVARRSAGAG